jgi:hypothetical protein
MVFQNSLMFYRGTRAATASEMVECSPADCNTATPQNRNSFRNNSVASKLRILRGEES